MALVWHILDWIWLVIQVAILAYVAMSFAVPQGVMLYIVDLLLLVSLPLVFGESVVRLFGITVLSASEIGSIVSVAIITFMQCFNQLHKSVMATSASQDRQALVAFWGCIGVALAGIGFFHRDSPNLSNWTFYFYGAAAFCGGIIALNLFGDYAAWWHNLLAAKWSRPSEVTVMGDYFQGITGPVFSRVHMRDAITNINKQDTEIAKDLLAVTKAVQASGSKEAGQLLEGFSTELQKPTVNKPVLRSLWDGLVKIVPEIAKMTQATASIGKLLE